MKPHGLLVLSSLTLSTLTATLNAAEPPPPRELSLQECVQLALQHNLDVQIERYNPQLALFTLRGNYGGYEPSLTMSGQHDHTETGAQLIGGGFVIPGSQSDDDRFSSSLAGGTPWGMTYSLQGNTSDTWGHSGVNAFENSGGSASASLTQPLLKNFWIDSTRLNIRVAKNRVKYSELGLKLRIMNTASSVEQAYYDLIYAREFVAVQERAVELALRLVEENKKRVEVGAMAPLDEKQAASQAAASQADLISARYSLMAQENTVKQLISDQYSEWQPLSLKPTGTLAAPRQLFDLQDSWSKGLSLRPDYLQARLDLERVGIQLKFAKNQLWPELDVFASYGYNGSGSMPNGEFSDALYDIQRRDRPFYTYGGRITIPLGNSLARNNYKSSKATQSQLVLTLKKLEQGIMVQIDNDIKQAVSNFERVDATRKAREYAEDALAAEQKKLENGKSTTFEVLRLQRDLTAARGSEIQALATYNKTLSQLSLDEGSTLDRLAIDVNAK
jgi:outer membrane protein